MILSSHANDSGSAFTLVELLVGVFIMSILLTSLCGIYMATAQEWLRESGQNDALVATSQACVRISDYVSQAVGVTVATRFFASDTLLVETGGGGGDLLLMSDDTRELECEAFHTTAAPGSDSGAPPDALLRSYANWVLNTGREFVVRPGAKTEDETELDRDDRPAMAVPLLWHSSAMRSRRRYRDVMPGEELVEELNRSAGRTMDPTVVDALRRLMDRGDLTPVYQRARPRRRRRHQSPRDIRRAA